MQNEQRKIRHVGARAEAQAEEAYGNEARVSQDAGQIAAEGAHRNERQAGRGVGWTPAEETDRNEARARRTTAQVPSEAAKRAADAAYAHQREQEAVAAHAPVERHSEAYVAFEDEIDFSEEQLDEKRPKGNRERKHKKPMGKVKKIVLFSLLGLLAVGLVLAGKYAYDITHPETLFTQPSIALTTPPPTAPPAVSSAPGGSTTPEATPTPDPEAMLLSQADLAFMKNRVNVLILGLDESTERANWGSFRTDTMILVTIDFTTNDVCMISVPRDSYVKICNASAKPTGSFGKINSAFPAGGGAQKNGFEYAMGTVSYLLGGIPINYYVGFNMNVVKEVVNAMGGVDYDVDIDVHMNGRTLSPGKQHLDGQSVLDYCRQRKGSSDIARVDRQQRMIMEIFRQLKSTGQITNIPDIYKAVEQNIQTNLDFTQISALALLAMRMDTSQLQRRTTEGEFMDLYSASYWGLHTAKIQDMVKEVFGIDVRIDGEVSATNVRKQVEANRALIASELSAANAAIKTANSILANYDTWLSDGTRSQLKAAKSQLEDAVDSEDKAQLDACTPPLVQLNNAIMDQLRQHGAITGTDAQQPAQPNPTPNNPDIPYIPEIPVIPQG